MSAVGAESQIEEALLLRLTALILSPALPVAYPNVTFPAVGTTKPDVYLEASFLPGAPQTIGISDWSELPGYLQVDVVYKTQNGELKPRQIAGAVADWFERGTRLTNGAVQVDIYDRPAIGKAMPDSPYIRIPVSIRYRSFVEQ